MDIFKDDQDYLNFLKRICLVLGLPTAILINYTQGVKTRNQIIALPKNCLDILFFVLMPNHFHFVVKQNSIISPSKFIHKLCTSYSMYFSKKYGHVGNLFQDQFKSVQITSDSQLLWLSSYIHLNPIKAGIVESLNDYRWSSYLEYKNNISGICNKEFFIQRFGSSKNFFKNTLKEFKKNEDESTITLE